MSRVRVLKKDLEKQVFDLRNLLEISKSLSSTLDYHLLNDSILFTCLGALTVLKAAYFSKKNFDAVDFTLHRSFLGFELDHGHPYSIPESGPLVAYLAAHPTCHDPDDLYRQLGASDEIAVLQSLAPSILVPLKAKGAVNGLLVLGEKIDGQPFDDRDRDYLSDIAGLAAIAIHNAALFEMTTTDRMTKLKLKHFFLNRLGEPFLADPSERGRFSLLMLDIDHFKRVNDTLGHLAGDDTLTGVAALVLEEVRVVDVAARYGGEEFVVLLPGTDADGAFELAERIRRRVEATGFVSGRRTVRVTLSAGVAEFDPGRDMTPSALVERADRALYESKQTGRNRTTRAS